MTNEEKNEVNKIFQKWIFINRSYKNSEKKVIRKIFLKSVYWKM